MKKLLSCFVALLMGMGSGAIAADPTHYTETLPPQVTTGALPVANGYDWTLSTYSSAPTVKTNALTVTGALTQTGGNLGFQYLVPVSSTVVIGAAAAQIVPSSSYIVISPNLLAASSALTGTPTISTATALGGQTAYPDGMYLVVSGTSSATSVQLQDNGTLAGSQLFLGSASNGAAIAFTLVSSTITKTFVYNATNKGWNLIH